MDEILHQVNAVFILKHLNANAARAQEFFFPLEGAVLANDYARDSVKQDSSGTHGAGGKSGVEYRLAIYRCGAAACIFQGIHLTVPDGAAVLHAPVVTAAYNLSSMYQHRADWYAAFCQPQAGLFNGSSEEFV